MTEVEKFEETNDEAEEESSESIELDESQRQGVVEALLLASGDPLEFRRIADVTGIEDSELKDILESITMKFELEESGFQLVEIAGKFQFRTRAEYGPFIQKLKAGRPRRLSPAALETLAIIAYRQPIVKSDIEKIRGVDATPTIKTLLDRSIVRIVGHKATAGQPALYGTTEKFLSIFGLRSLSELPSLRDLKELESDPGEVEDSEEDHQTETQSVETTSHESNQEQISA